MCISAIACTFLANASFSFAALPPPGSAIAWGDNSAGQIGDGTQTERDTQTPVSGLASGVVQVSGGIGHGIALLSNGSVQTWGDNSHGQLGIGTVSTTPQLAPGMVPTLTGITAISAGGSFNLALKSDGTAWAWGDNSAGQLGDGSTTVRSTPVQVSGLISGVIAVAAGGSHSLALKSDGTLFGWGSNAYGQIGDGSSTDRLTPTQVCAPGETAPCINFLAVRKSTNLSQPSIAAGLYHTLAVTSDGAVVAWGRNNFAQLGTGAAQDDTPNTIPVEVTGLSSGWLSTAAGDHHSLALNGIDGSVSGWGQDGFGQVGNGTTATSISSPVQVTGLTSSVGAIIAKGGHSLALKGGAVVGWGENQFGTVGDGTSGSTANRNSPTQVLGLTGGVLAIGGGTQASYAVRALVPGSPSVVSATAGDASATVSWTAPASNGGSPITGYSVTPYIGTTAQTATSFTSTATSQTVSGLTNGMTYTFTVAASNVVGSGPESAASNAVAPASLATIPGAPSAVSATRGDAKATVGWTAPASDGGSAITGYRVTPYIGTTAQTATIFNSPGTSQTISGLTNGTTYTFKVAAINGVGTGPDSAASNAVTPLAPYVAGVIGTNGALYALANGSANFTADGGVLLGAPAVVSLPQTSGPGLPLYLGTGTNHNLYVRNDTRGWQPLTTSPFYCIDNPAGVVIGSTLYVACQGSNNGLWHAETTAPTGTNLPSLPFSAWQSLGGVLIAGPSVAAVAGTPTYVVVGTGNQVYQRTLTTGYTAISSWRCTGHPALASSGTTTYFACHGLDGALYFATNSGGGWSAAQSLGGGLIDGPGIAAAASGPIFFAEGTDHALYHRSISGPWVKDGGGLQYGAAAAAL